MPSDKNLKNLLRRPQDALILILWVSLGLLPSGMLFFWIERNCTLPWIPQELGWPWMIVDGTLADSVFWNGVLLLFFGVVHSLLAVPSIRKRVFLGAHPKNHRALYIIATGVSSLIVMSHWQSTGVVLFHLFDSAILNSFLSVFLFWSVVFVIHRVSEPLGMNRFLGLPDLLSTPAEWNARQGALASEEKLITTGTYAKVRHPIYTLTLLAILLTPFLSLDRLIVFSVFFVYIQIGYRLEERKLIGVFGREYEEYRKKVPALFPKL